MDLIRIMARTNIKIVPEINACIETKAKKEYQHICNLVSQGGTERSLIQRLELLRLFLETADFRKLRSDSEQLLIQGKRITFVISEKSGSAVFKMDVI